MNLVDLMLFCDLNFNHAAFSFSLFQVCYMIGEKEFVMQRGPSEDWGDQIRIPILPFPEFGIESNNPRIREIFHVISNFQ